MSRPAPVLVLTGPTGIGKSDWALRLARPGALILVDNVVRDGRILNADSAEPDLVGVRRLFERMANEPRVTATAIQTVGVKGWDGLAIARVADGAAGHA